MFTPFSAFYWSNYTSLSTNCSHLFNSQSIVRLTLFTVPEEKVEKFVLFAICVPLPRFVHPSPLIFIFNLKLSSNGSFSLSLSLSLSLYPSFIQTSFFTTTFSTLELNIVRLNIHQTFLMWRKCGNEEISMILIDTPIIRTINIFERFVSKSGV